MQKKTTLEWECLCAGDVVYVFYFNLLFFSGVVAVCVSTLDIMQWKIMQKEH